MNLNNLRIGTRLTIGFGAVLALLLVIVGIAYFQLARTNSGVAELDGLERGAAIARNWVSKTQLNVARTVAIAKASGQPDIEKYFSPLIKTTSAEISTLQKSMEGLLTSDQGKALLAKVASERDAYVALRNQVFEHVKQADAPAADALLANKMMPASEAYLAAMAAVQDHQVELAATESQALSGGIRSASSVLLMLLALSVAVGATMAYFITRSVTGPLQEGVKTAELIAGGDLSQTLHSTRRDEIGELLRALGQMQQSLHQLVGQVRSSTDSISTASAEIATGNQDLSMRTEQTASNLQQAAASMEQLTGTVAQSADSARQANRLAASAAEVAGRGGVVVSQVVSTMNEINTSSKQISDIVGVIDGIAFQTNILALNAAVEAARAGEQGRGFAVVASEVRSLAQRSAQAAKEIKVLIGASVDKVESGSRLVAAAGQTMHEIVDSVRRVSDIVGEITTAATEQSNGIGQMHQSVSQLDQMTQQNAALVEQSAAAAESLQGQTVKLASLVAVFKLGSGQFAHA
ncbi:MAG: methyl-accepting chemotaxis protein [Burkholderiales bacterium]|nr:methyl-accepting chemotaxis protein [Burkholderiales bacterium]